MPPDEAIGYQSSFRKAVPVRREGCIRVTHPCAGRQRSKLPVTPRLACVRPVASVHPEPGSNSPLYKFLSEFLRFSFATRHSSSELGSALAARRIVKSCCLYSRTAIQIEVSHKESQVRKTYQCIHSTYYIIYKVRTLLVLLLLVLCKSIQRSLLLFACQGVSLESGCKSTAFS